LILRHRLSCLRAFCSLWQRRCISGLCC
jgi:hypothetical protein